MSGISEVDKTKLEYFEQREKDSEALQKMIKELELDTFMQDLLVSNIVTLAYEMGVRYGKIYRDA